MPWPAPSYPLSAKVGKFSWEAAQYSALVRLCRWAQVTIVRVSWQRVGGPYRRSVGADDGLNGGSRSVMFSGVPGVDGFAFDAGGGFGQPVGGEQFAVADHVRPALDGDVPQRVVQVRRLSGEDLDALRRHTGRRWRGRCRTRRRAGRGPLPCGTKSVPEVPGNGRSAPGCVCGCRARGVQRPAAGQGTARVPWARRPWHDRQSRGALSVDGFLSQSTCLSMAPRQYPAA